MGICLFANTTLLCFVTKGGTQDFENICGVLYNGTGGAILRNLP